MGIIINPMVSKWGVMAFVVTSDTPAAATGFYPLQTITAVGGSPTIKVNGQQIAIGSAKAELTRLDNAMVAYQLQCGSVSNIRLSVGALTSYTAPTATADSASLAKGLVISSAVLPMESGVLSYTVTNGGTGYPDVFFAQVAGGSCTFPASVVGFATGGVVQSLKPFTGDWCGHGVGYTGNFTNGTFSGAVNSGDADDHGGCTFSGFVGNYITKIPVINGGSGLIAKPTITISDTGGGTGAYPWPTMSGPLASDTLTYSAPANWLTTSGGNAPAATDQQVFNYVGRLEGPCHSLPDIANIKPKVQVGLNHPPQATYVQNNTLWTGKDRMLAGGQWQNANVVLDDNQNPVSWDPGVQISALVYYNVQHYYDLYKSGTWTVKYRDAFYAGTTTETTVINLGAADCYSIGPPTTTVVGDVVTKTYEVTFTWAPGTVGDGLLAIFWGSSDSTNHVTHPNNPNVFRPLVMGPNNIDNGLYYDADDNIVRNLSPDGVTGPAFIRPMDTYFGYAGMTNYCQNSDRMPTNLSSFNWSSGSSGLTLPGWSQNNQFRVITFEFLRYYNSDPAKGSAGDNTYPWPASTKLYNQSGFVVKGTDSLGSYLEIADGPNGASDDGRVMLSGNGDQNVGILEFRTTQPGGHLLNTGQNCAFNANAGGQVLPWKIRGDFNTFAWGFDINFPVFVTGPDTLGIPISLDNGSGSVADTLNSTAEIPCNISLYFSCPLGSVAPVEYHCGLINRLPNADLWHNAPSLGTTQHDMSGFHYSNGFTIGQNLGPTHGVRFEWANEWWNTGNPFTHFFLQVQAKFPSYAPPSLPIYGGLLTAGQALLYDQFAQVISAGQAFLAFKAGWVAAGRDPAQLKHYIGEQWTASGEGPVNIVKSFSIPCDGIMVATYSGMQADSGGGNVDGSLIDAYYPAGAYGGPTSAESWPVWQCNDLTSLSILFATSNQKYWNMYSQFTGPAGIPLVCYEGGIDGIAPAATTFNQESVEDQLFHRSFYDVVWRYEVYNQLGDWTMANSGAVAASYYTWGGSGGTPGLNGWKVTAGPIQQPGMGLSNSFMTPQADVNALVGRTSTITLAHIQHCTGFAPVNESPGLQAIVDWNKAVSGTPTPTTTATLSGPTSGTVGVATTFNVRLDGTFYTGTVTVSVSPGGGTLTPTSLSWSGTAQAQAFTYTPSATGSFSISISASPALTIAGSPITYIATTPTPTPTPTPTGPMPSRAAIMVTV